MEALELKGYRYAASNKEVKRMKLSSLKIVKHDFAFIAISVVWVFGSVGMSVTI